MNSQDLRSPLPLSLKRSTNSGSDAIVIIECPREVLRDKFRGDIHSLQKTCISLCGQNDLDVHMSNINGDPIIIKFHKRDNSNALRFQ